MRGACGRADLIRALVAGGPAMLATTAAALGFVPAPERREETPSPDHPRDNRTPPPSAERRPEPAPAPSAPSYWYLSELEPVPAEADAKPDADAAARARTPVVWHGPAFAPEPQPLATWRTLVPRLRRAVALPMAVGEIDTDAILRRLDRGGLIDRLPRKRRSRWVKRLQIIDDRSNHLIPYWSDQDWVVERLRRLLPRHAIERARLWPGHDAPVILNGRHPAGRYRPPPAGTVVLVLGDLGCLARDRSERIGLWRELGRQLHAARCRLAALLPCPPERWPASLAPLWPMVAWERPFRPVSANLDARADRLLRLVSPAVRLEPGFLRDVRLLLPPGDADAGTEADVWGHPSLIGASSVAATLDPEAGKGLRAGFADETPELREKVLSRLRAWRAGLPLEIWCEEIADLDPDSRARLPDARDIGVSEALFAEISREFQAVEGVSAADRVWFGRLERRIGDHLWTDPGVGDALQRMWAAVHRADDTPPPPGLKLSLLSVGKGPPRRLELRERDDELIVSPPGVQPDGCPLGHIETRDQRILVTPVPSFWASGLPPSWAADWGYDRFGAWVSFAVGGVTQRLRWIPAGRFTMGSPDDEPGRYSDEGPRHEVSIDRGFWLMDTPCTQALWRAVMGTNPSHFEGSERPVEQVSWDDVREFLGKLNERLSGLDLSLPSEAQWEYACRAGTDRALPVVEGEVAVVDAIAWHRGNSEGQTQPVAKKAPNGWGLHDMLGNIWEWCADEWNRTYAEAPADGTAWVSLLGADHVLRGGSMSNNAREIRAAYRSRFPPDDRYYSIGFRCARVQIESQADEERMEPADPVRAPLAERRAAQRPTSGAVTLRVASGGAERCPLPRGPLVRIDSESDRLTLARITGADCRWANAIGRDHFGLWASFAVKGITQRLRWIPPGRFMMGSPESEIRRDKDEGPQHPVTLTRGFWLFDTACTQALWGAVMEYNPGFFREKSLPMVSVSWGSVQEFLEIINKTIIDLNADSADRGAMGICVPRRNWNAIQFRVNRHQETGQLQQLSSIYGAIRRDGERIFRRPRAAGSGARP